MELDIPILRHRSDYSTLKFSYDDYLNRLIENEAEEKGITFAEFRDFGQFLNNLDDFAIAMRMYSLAGRSISQGPVIKF